jgi:hypothetical protein
LLQLRLDEDLEATHAVDVTDAKKRSSLFVVFGMESQGVDTRKSAWYAAVGAAAALVPAIVMWGFTVDDALISIRYAHNLVTGGGYAFNAHAAATDGVTPLPWPFVLAPLADSSDLVAVLVRAKVLGILAWTAAGAALGRSIRSPWPLLVVALAFPIGAWAASGMETGIAIALCTFAAISFYQPLRAGALAGIAAAFRPELLPWALVLAMGAAIVGTAKTDPLKRRVLPVILAFGPFAACMLVRSAAFGAVVPLAVMAKPSDAAHGIVYAVAAVVVGLLPVLLVAPFALRQASPRAKVLVIGLGVHALVMTAVGGDWMPYARLIVPILPSLALAAADIEEVSHKGATIARYVIAVSLGIYTCLGAAPTGRHVQSDRADLIARARPVLADAKVIAALDIGWASAASDAKLVDLAGLTDPSIAILSGGHTSKAVDVGMLLDRNVDTVLILSPSRIVEQRFLMSELFNERFEERESLQLGTESRYLIFRRRP